MGNGSLMKLPSKGWGPFRYEWYSICSGHETVQCTMDCGLIFHMTGGYHRTDCPAYEEIRNKHIVDNCYGYDSDCSRCIKGRWVNCWIQKVETWLYENQYQIWYWWITHRK